MGIRQNKQKEKNNKDTMNIYEQRPTYSHFQNSDKTH